MRLQIDMRYHRQNWELSVTVDPDTLNATSLAAAFDALHHARFGFAVPALLRADDAEDVDGRRALVLRYAGPRAASGPATGDLVLLPGPGFIAEPDLYVVATKAMRAPTPPTLGASVRLAPS